jgi:hypothetical protein
MTKPGERKAGRKKGHEHWVLDDAGERTALTPALGAALVAHSRAGRWPQSAAVLCHVTPETLLGWVERGAEQCALEPYRSFAEAFLESEMQNCADLESVVQAAALGRNPKPKGGRRGPDVETAKWLLERRYAFLWKGGGLAAASVVASSQTRKALREKAEAYLALLPDHERARARELGFMLVEGSRT